MKKHYLLQFFAYEHLSPELQEISKPFGELAKQIVETLPENPESTTALRFLMQAKDCAVRARIFKAVEYLEYATADVQISKIDS